MTERKSYREPL